MNRSHFFGLLAGAAAATVAAVPAFAEDGERGLEKALKASDGARSETAQKKLQELAARVRARVGQGTIKSIDAAAKSFVLAAKQGDVSVTTNAETDYHQGRNQNLGFDALKVGQHVIVQSDRPAANATATPLLARRVIILPERKERPQRMVTVGSVTNPIIASDGKGSFTLNPVTPAGSPAVNFVVDADTVYTLKGIFAFAAGQRARVVSIKNDAGQNVARQVRVPAGN